MDEAAIIPEKDERQLLQEFMTILPEGNQLSKSIRNLLAKKNEESEDDNDDGDNALMVSAKAPSPPGISVKA